jgi:hypothetical protein
VVSPATNYVSLSATFQAVAAGQALSYQWYKGSILLAGATDSALTLSPLQLSDAGNYSVQVSNPKGITNSPAVPLTVLPIPTNAAALNLTNALVLHLPFDGDYKDISGHANNGTNVGATSRTCNLAPPRTSRSPTGCSSPPVPCSVTCHSSLT